MDNSAVLGGDYVVGLVTAPASEAAQLARSVVESNLAACVNIIPAVRSIYRWQGELCDDEESQLIIKTRAEHVEALRDRLIALHSYDVPEVIFLPVVSGNPAYLSWIDAQTK